MAKKPFIYFLTFLLVLACNQNQKTLYNNPPLILSDNTLSDGLGSFQTEDLPSVSPKTELSLYQNATPIMVKMFKIALNDIEKNMVTNDLGTYFAAGRRYTDRVYTRDIAFAGILGLNTIFPEEMKKSLMITRVVRGELGYKVSAEHVIPEIDVPWEIISKNEQDVMAQYKTNSYTRRTDDVVWIWAVDDLFQQYPKLADWEWFYTTGKENFERFYDPWFDVEDGLFRAQPTFQDIASNGGYPKNMTISDCVLLKGTSTNCMYYKAMLAMANAAQKNMLPDEAENWLTRAEKLKTAILKELKGIPNRDGRKYVFAERGWHWGPLMRTDGLDLSRSVTSEKYHFIYNTLPKQEFAPVGLVKEKAWDDIKTANTNNKLNDLHNKFYFYDERPIFELYDVENDPFELINLEGKEKFKDIEKEHREELEKWMVKHHDFLPLPSHVIENN